jgi:hypothetical protein
MYKIKLSTGELSELNKLKQKHQSNRKILRRLRAIEFNNNWFWTKYIKDSLDVWKNTVTEWFKLYNKWWFSTLIDLKFKWKKISEFEQYHSDIITEINNNTLTYWDLYGKLKSKHNNLKSWMGWLWKYCKKKQILFSKNVKSNLENAQIH